MSVQVQGLTKRFTASGTPAVADVSFEAPSGAVTALIGPSGSGKSTVLRLVAGLELPDAGRVLIDDVEVTASPVQRRGVGLVFQSYALFSHMSVRDNIAFALQVRRRGRAEVEARVEELLRLIQLAELADRYPGQLSGGQRQRVALARALAIEPRVLLLDEPFGALDARVRVELREWLLRFHEATRVTTILVTHDQDEALELAQHVVVMLAGEAAQAGPPLEVYDHPATPAVASFLGASLLRGHVRNGRAEVGPFAIDAPPCAREGDRVEAYVRPHDLVVAHAGDDGQVRAGKILRLRPVGGHVKVTLGLHDGQSVIIEASRGELDALSLREGDEVFVDLRAARLFLADYSI